MQNFEEAKCKYIYVGDGQNGLAFRIYEDTSAAREFNRSFNYFS